LAILPENFSALALGVAEILWGSENRPNGKKSS